MRIAHENTAMTASTEKPLPANTTQVISDSPDISTGTAIFSLVFILSAVAVALQVKKISLPVNLVLLIVMCIGIALAAWRTVPQLTTFAIAIGFALSLVLTLLSLASERLGK